MPNIDPPLSFPDTPSVSMLRAWYAGMGSREAVERYHPDALRDGKSARGVIGRVRRQIVEFALNRHREDLARLFQCPANEREYYRKAATLALDMLPSLQAPQPQVTDPVDIWLPVRVAAVLHQHGSVR